MKKTSFSLLVFVGFFLFTSSAQEFPKYFQSNIVRVMDSLGSDLKNPFGGGLAFPTFASFDLNNDGKEDLVILERADNKILTYINEGNGNFIYRPEYEKFFPDSLASFIVMMDYNGDGKKDLFTYASTVGAGVAVYKNVSTPAEGIKFEMVEEYLKSFFYGEYGEGKLYNLPMFPVDIPTIIDVDGDGDLDVLLFDELGGAWLRLYINMSQELYGNSDSLLFTCIDLWWGEFMEEDDNNNILLYQKPNEGWDYRWYNQNWDSIRTALSLQGVLEPTFRNTNVELTSMKKIPKRHAGSTVLAWDIDGDGDLDLIIGDVDYPGLTLLENSKADSNLKYNRMFRKDNKFPSNDKPVWIRQMPAAYFIDVDNDGIRDMICAPINMDWIDTFQNLNQIWYYKNHGADNNWDMRLVKDDFLQKDMIDLGGATAPVFFDIDGDGDMDLFVATKGSFHQTFYKNDRVFFFENIGNADTAVFIMRDDDWMNLSTKGHVDMTLAFGDIDGDGDMDLLIGQKNGKISYYENTASAGNPPVFSFVSNNYQNIQVAENSAPFIYDIDGDGLNDLVIGQRTGKLSYYRNTGSIGNPTFTLEKDTFGGVLIPGWECYTYPVIHDLDNNGYPELILGYQVYDQYKGLYRGRINVFADITKDINAKFTMIDSLIVDPVTKTYNNFSLGYRIRPAVAKLDGDSIPDIIAGNLRGGLLLFGTNSSLFTEITADKADELCIGDSVTLSAGSGFDTYKWNTGEATRQILVKTGGNYSCEVRKGSFTYTAYFTVTEHKGSVEAAFTSSLDERYVEFTNQNKYVKTIYWDFGDGNYSFDLNPKHTYIQAGTYKVCMSLVDHCGVTGRLCRNINIVSSIEQADREIFSIYPNPVTNILHIKVIDAAGTYKLELLDVTGKNLKTFELDGSKQLSIPFDNYEKGLYMIRISGGKDHKVRVMKVVKY